jgi:hypothetical protein
MPDRRRRHCNCCGKHVDAVGPISWRGNCANCIVLLLDENARGISAKAGPAHRRRLRGYAKWLDREALDAAQANP